jgi:hypothetical protein
VQHVSSGEKMNKKFLFFLIILPILFSCSRNRSISNDYSIVGTWQGKTEKTTMTLIFYPNSDLRIYYENDQGKKEFVLKYKLDKNEIDFSDDFERSQITFLDKDRILIRPMDYKIREFIDVLYIIEFKRVKGTYSVPHK